MILWLKMRKKLIAGAAAQRDKFMKFRYFTRLFVFITCIAGASSAATIFDFDTRMPMSFVYVSRGGNCAECEWISAEGTIEKDTPAKFKKYLNENPSRPGRIAFNSPGGSLQAALELGELIRQQRLMTQVYKTVGSLDDDIVKDGDVPDNYLPRAPVGCRSACVYAFLGGINRTASDGDIWIHQFFDPIALSDFLGKTSSGYQRALDQALSGRLIEYLTRMGISVDLLAKASQVKPTDPMYGLTKSEMIELRVDNSEPFFTPMDIKASSNGAFVEIINKSTYRDYQVRIFCSQTPDRLGLQILSALTDDDQGFIDGLADRIDHVIFKHDSSERSFSVKPIVSRASEGVNIMSFGLKIIGATMNDIQNADKVELEGGWGTREELEVGRMSFELKGDHRKIGVVARNCLH
jgi:hypothetical protein